MNISQNCLDIIKKWEGFKADAYIDPVGIPTIGYGTIRYPDGRKVKLGEKVSKAEAEKLLKFEVDEAVKNLKGALAGITLTQNQFDAVVSLCYNIGVSAFKDSTVLKKLKAGDFEAASKAFEMWNKGRVDGVLKELPGLTRRRRDERKLFDKKDGGGRPVEAHESPRDTATRLEGYRDGDKSIIVALAGDRVIEILALKSPGREDFISALQKYKNAKTFEFAPAGKAVPEGERTEIGEKTEDISSEAGKAVNLKRGNKGEPVEKLQDALVRLGCLTQAEVDTGYGTFGQRTEAAVKLLQKQLGFAQTGEFKDPEQEAVDKILAGIGKGNPAAELVKAIQVRLLSLGFMTQAQVDTGFGTFGSQTDAAVKKFQKEALLPESGVIEAVTFKLLFKEAKFPASEDIFAPPDGENYTIKQNADVYFTKPLEAKVAAVAKIYFEQTQKKLIVTSGYRPPSFQAAAMFGKILNEGEAEVRRLYRRSGSAIAQILDAYRNNREDRQKAIEAIKEIIEKQMTRGVYISNHLLSNAVDIRKTANWRALDAATRTVGGRVVIEADHFHLELT